MTDQATASPRKRQALTADIQNLSAFVWSIAEILRGDFKQSEYGKVILPFVVMRRLDCILEDSKETVLAAEKSIPDSADEPTRDMILFGAVGKKIRVYNLSRFTFETLKHIRDRLPHARSLRIRDRTILHIRDSFFVTPGTGLCYEAV